MSQKKQPFRTLLFTLPIIIICLILIFVTVKMAKNFTITILLAEVAETPIDTEIVMESTKVKSITPKLMEITNYTASEKVYSYIKTSTGIICIDGLKYFCNDLRGIIGPKFNYDGSIAICQ